MISCHKDFKTLLKIEVLSKKKRYGEICLCLLTHQQESNLSLLQFLFLILGNK